MSDNLGNDDNFVVERFSCDCLYQGHILDMSLELADEGKRIVEVSLYLYMDGKAPLKYRLKQIWKLLRGEEGQLADFILRKEDIPNLIALLRRAVHITRFSSYDPRYDSGIKWEKE